MISVRFKQNLILTTVYTTTTKDGTLKAEKIQTHVKKGEIYAAEQVNASSESSLTIFFGDNIIKGVATNVDKDVCEIFSPAISAQAKGVATAGQIKPGCGGCRGRGHS